MPPAVYPGSLTDIAGLRVGHFTDGRRPTGCSVVLCEHGATCGVEVRGGAPGTRETDLLKSEHSVQQVHAVLLTGGSAFGLDAASGVMRWLEERGHGLAVGPARVPLVPAAVLFDLWMGDARIRPDAAAGYAACEDAVARQVPMQGRIGAGAGASVGKLFGVERSSAGGVGSASLRVGGVTVAALVAVNALGDVLDEQGRVLAGVRAVDGAGHLADGYVSTTQALCAGAAPPRWAASLAGSATTIGVVATDAPLTKTQANRLASLAHHGLSRAIDPITQHDGDTLFALATGTARVREADLSALGALAAEVVARAIRNAVRAAASGPTPPR